MNIVLCGMMGCGKTTVAKALANKLGREAVDTDEWIEREYGSISRIFAEHGEGYFRDLETETAKHFSHDEKKILSVGGGFVLRAENVEWLRKNGRLVYLQAKKETLQKRLEGDTSRPLLQGDSLSERLDRLLFERSAVYESVCDLTVSVDEKSPAEIADEVVELLRMKGAGIG